MDCSDHPPPITVAVPAELQAFAPDNATTITQCPRCLTVQAGGSDPQPVQEISSVYPSGTAGVGVVLLISLLDALAHNRSEINELVTIIEQHGTDVFATLSRLHHDPAVDPAVPLDRRITQLEQFLA